MKKEDIDLGYIIANSIAGLANDSRAQMGHASIITELCLNAKCVENEDDQRLLPRSPINASWIDKVPVGLVCRAAPQQTGPIEQAAGPPSEDITAGFEPQGQTSQLPWWQKGILFILDWIDRGEANPHLMDNQLRGQLEIFRREMQAKETTSQLQHPFDALLNEDDTILD